jgi:hypothetical protein
MSSQKSGTGSAKEVVITFPDDEISKSADNNNEKKNQNRIFLIATIIGYIAVVSSIAVYVPLVIDVITDPTGTYHLNPWQYWLSLLSNVLWLIYAAALKAWPLLAASAAIVVMLVVILVQKYITPSPISPILQA